MPDIVVGATGSLTGSSWGGVIALMGMHLVVAVCGIVSFRVFLPLTSGKSRPPLKRDESRGAAVTQTDRRTNGQPAAIDAEY